MTVRLGVIADDFTGATDIAGFLVAGGLRTTQLTGLPGPYTQIPDGTDAVVISLKSRSIPPDEAVSMSLTALEFLQKVGAERFYFKYCSTFDSTPEGNIGPVTDALLDRLDQDFTVVCPALPVNGRTTYKGYLFVHDVPLHESGMRNHPITPMTDSSLVRLMDGQSQGRTGTVEMSVVEQGAEAVRSALASLREQGFRYAVLDALTDEHVRVLGAATSDLRLTTGGSGLGGGLAEALSGGAGASASGWADEGGRTVVLSGSASEMTNSQVAAYQEKAPSWAVDVDRLLQDPDAYADEVRSWVLEQPETPAPMVYATAGPDEVSRIQAEHGAERASAAVEDLFARLSASLAEAGVRRFIVAGGETSGSVTTALGVTGFEVGPQIAPGVPWVRSLNTDIDLALKSGNFGAEDFFTAAQQPAI